jgi:hypothetical protein
VIWMPNALVTYWTPLRSRTNKEPTTSFEIVEFRKNIFGESIIGGCGERTRTMAADSSATGQT